MNANEDDRSEAALLRCVEEEVAKVQGLGSPEHFSLSIGEVPKSRRSPDWNDKCEKWGDHQGIYYFVKDDRVVYVGRALPPNVTLYSRVRTQVHCSRGDADSPNSWRDEVLDDPSVTVGLLRWTGEWWWILALEARLIEVLGMPRFNQRVS